MKTTSQPHRTLVALLSILGLLLVQLVALPIPAGAAGEPGPFGKAGPADGAVGQPLTVNLSWGASAGDPTPGYFYCYDTTNDGSCSGWWAASSGVAIGPLSPGTTYYWQVMAVNSQGAAYADGSPTSFWRFTTGTSFAPGAFGKAGPANGAVGQPLAVTLSWGVSAGAPTPTYRYCYDTTNDGACGSWTTTGATSATTGSLSPNTTYYWQVLATNTQGTTYADGNATAFWQFTTGSAPPPGAFGKIGPANGAVSQPLSVTLSWSASPGLMPPIGGRYFYCYDTSNDGRCELWTSTTATSAVIGGLSANTSYYWHVLALSSQGTTYADGSATAFWKFTTRSATTPVTTQFRARGAFDGWVLESAEQSGRGGSLNSWDPTCRVGDDAGDRQFRSILHFATGRLPDDAVVTSVSLRIKSAGFTGSNPFVSHDVLTTDIRRGGFNSATPLEFADFQAAASRASVANFGASPAGGWYSADLAAAAYQFVNRRGPTQFRLRFSLDDNDDGGADYLSFLCGNVARSVDRPVLTITYYLP